MPNWILCLIICGVILLIGALIYMWADDMGMCYSELDIIKVTIGAAEVIVFLMFKVTSKKDLFIDGLVICGVILLIGVLIYFWCEKSYVEYKILVVIRLIVVVAEASVILVFNAIDIGVCEQKTVYTTTSEFQATVSECYDANDDYYVILTKKNGFSHRYSIAEEDCTLLEVGDIVTVTNKNDDWYYISGIVIQYDSDVTDLTNYSFNYNNTALPKKGENK